MFKNMKVGAKITSGFALVTILGIIVGIAGYVIINKITHQVEIAEMAYKIKENSLETRRQEKNYIIRKQEEYFKRWETAAQEIKTVASKGQKITDDGDIQGWLKDSLKGEHYQFVNKKINDGVILPVYTFQRLYHMCRYISHTVYEAFHFLFLQPTMHQSASFVCDR